MLSLISCITHLLPLFLASRNLISSEWNQLYSRRICSIRGRRKHALNNTKNFIQDGRSHSTWLPRSQHAIETALSYIPLKRESYKNTTNNNGSTNNSTSNGLCEPLRRTQFNVRLKIEAFWRPHSPSRPGCQDFRSRDAFF